MRRLAHGIHKFVSGLLAFASLAVPMSMIAGQETGQEPPVSDRFRAAMTRAAELPNGNEFNLALRSVANELPRAELWGADNEPNWNSWTVNRAGVGVDAIRFRSPLTAPADMAWVFAGPENLRSWYIVPVGNVAMQGFTNYQDAFNLDIEGLDLPTRNRVYFQCLNGGHIQPNQEYIIWFRFASQRPGILRAGMKLVRAGASKATDATPSTVAQELGLQWPVRLQTAAFKFVPASDE